MNLIEEIWAAIDRARTNPKRQTEGSVKASEIIENFSSEARTKWDELKWPQVILDEDNDFIKRFGNNMGKDVENL